MKSFNWGKKQKQQKESASSGFSILPRRWISKLKQSMAPKPNVHQQQQKEMINVTTLSDNLSFSTKSLGYYITNDPQPPRHSNCERKSDYYSISECRRGGLVHGLFRSRSERVNSTTGAGVCEENLHVPELTQIQTGRKDDDLIRKKIKRKKRVKVNSPRLVPLNNNKKMTTKKKKKKKKMMMAEQVSGRTKNLESFAVVKNSMDPQVDFRNSMIEMILEIKMARREEFESLLDCYLALNAEEYHDMIFKAFKQVWFVLYPNAPPDTTSSSSSSNL
ncbi:hypothetical protein ZOSMA_313G00250 [Zostera marina]|uniref:Transcription repressor n=1 Tax=Zostera marina TaxID=29655 RepID=A0A0K9PBW5_ZOSMR|nr:hypothetical protein ZOSMA_313G00250 [Zostera marina]